MAVDKAHQGGHPGESRLKSRVRSHFWIPDLDRLVKEKVSSCRHCQLYTLKTTKEPIATQKTTEKAWEEVSVDLFGPLPNGKHVLVVQDTMSRFPAAKIVPGTSASPVIGALDEVYTSYGQPDRHRTDNGPPFNSAEFGSYSQSKGVEHVLTYPHHPQGNPCETFMKPLGKALKAAFFNRDSAQEALDELLRAYRATPHPATGEAPGNILLRGGYRSDFPRQTINDQAVEEAAQRDKDQKLARKAEVNESRRRKAMDVSVGDEVLLRRYPKGRKFDPLYEDEVYEVVSVEDKGVTVQGDGGNQKRRHKDDIKRFRRPVNAGEEEPSEEALVAGRGDEDEASAASPAEPSAPLAPAPETGSSEVAGVAEVIQEGPTGTPTNLAPVEERPKRTRRPPSRLKDYVLKRLGLV